MPVINSACFTINNDISMDVLIEQEVDGLANAPAKLQALGRFDDQAINVITAVYLDINGQIKEIEVGVAGPEVSRKFPITKLFKDGPEGGSLRLNKFKFAQFKFPPGSCFSEWVRSDDLDWTVMKTKNAKDGNYPVDTYRDIGVGQWSCRLHISTCQEATESVVSLVAIPRLDLENLPGTATGSASEGFPGILLGEFPALMTGEAEENREDFLPFYPVCINRGGSDITVPTSGFLRSAMAAFWSSTTVPNTIISSDWTTATQGPGEPDQTVVRSEWTWPSVEEDDVDSAEEMVGEPTDRRVMLESQAQALAASIARTHGLQTTARGMGGTCSTSLTLTSTVTTTTPTTSRTTTSLTTTRATTTVMSTRPTSSGSTTTGPGTPIAQSTPSSVSGVKRKSGKRASSLIPKIPKFTTSQLLKNKPHLWPEGLSSEEVDCFTMTQVLTMKTLETTTKQQEGTDLVGTKMAKTDAKVIEVNIDEGTDDARTNLHHARFDLRPILEHPKKWYDQVKQKWPQVVRNLGLDFMGADLQINARTIASRHDRSMYIEAKYLLPKNHNVEARQPITRSTMRHGKLEHITEYDYQEPDSLEDMLTAVANLAALDHRLWPMDYTHIVINKVAAKYKFFKEAGRDSVRVFNAFFNKIMEANAGDPTRHPRTYNEGLRIARSVLSEWEYSEEVPANKSYRQNQDILPAPPAAPDNNRSLLVGKVPNNIRQLKIKNEEICADFNKRGCRKTVSPGAKGCLVAPGGTRIRLHACATTVRVSNGNPILCGLSHAATSCPKRK